MKPMSIIYIYDNEKRTVLNFKCLLNFSSSPQITIVEKIKNKTFNYAIQICGSNKFIYGKSEVYNSEGSVTLCRFLGDIIISDKKHAMLTLSNK